MSDREETSTKSLTVQRVFVDEDTQCGVFSVKSSLGCEYRVAVARSGAVTLKGPGVLWNTTRSHLAAKNMSLIGVAMLAALHWENRPTGHN